MSISTVQYGREGTSGECFQFQKTGQCVYGPNCRFLHNTTNVSPPNNTQTHQREENPTRQVQRTQEDYRRWSEGPSPFDHFCPQILQGADLCASFSTCKRTNEHKESRWRSKTKDPTFTTPREQKNILARAQMTGASTSGNTD